MSKVAKRANHKIDLRGDLKKIKLAVLDTTRDIKRKAGAIVSDHYDDVVAKSTAVRENLVEYVEDKPIKAVVMASVAGVLIGFLLRK